MTQGCNRIPGPLKYACLGVVHQLDYYGRIGEHAQCYNEARAQELYAMECAGVELRSGHQYYTRFTCPDGSTETVPGHHAPPGG
jgi:hypothetical protein